VTICEGATSHFRADKIKSAGFTFDFPTMNAARLEESLDAFVLQGQLPGGYESYERSEFKKSMLFDFLVRSHHSRVSYH
jgi:hypothetical protein